MAMRTNHHWVERPSQLIASVGQQFIMRPAIVSLLILSTGVFAADLPSIGDLLPESGAVVDIMHTTMSERCDSMMNGEWPLLKMPLGLQNTSGSILIWSLEKSFHVLRDLGSQKKSIMK
jgi:hypothetical protein